MTTGTMMPERVDYAADSPLMFIRHESSEHFNFSPESLGGITTRIILTVAGPDAVFAGAIKGGKQVFPVSLSQNSAPSTARRATTLPESSNRNTSFAPNADL